MELLIKYLSIIVLVQFLSSCNPNGGSRSCSCIQPPGGPTSSLGLSLQPTVHNLSPGATFTINQTHLTGTFTINAEAHPGMSINTGPWACDMVYKINGNIRHRQLYTAPASGGSQYAKTFIIGTELHTGTNIIEVGAECTNQLGTFCPIATYTIILTTIEGNIILKDECCSWSVRLQMTGNFTGASSVPGDVISGNLKIEKEVGSSWIQEGALIPFVNGGYTPCYQRPNQMGTQNYRAILLDFKNQPMNNLGTPLPKVFGICRECCPPIG